MMARRTSLRLTFVTIALPLAALFYVLAPLGKAAGAASSADKTFAGKVSQGGMYEVEASNVAVQKAIAQDVRDVANTKVHDHGLVNLKLKTIARGAGITLTGQSNATFQQSNHSPQKPIAS